MNDQPCIISGCSWAAKILGFRTLTLDFRNKLINLCLEKITIEGADNIKLHETFLNSLVGNQYLYPPWEIYQILTAYNIFMLCGMYLVPADIFNNTFAGLTYDGMVILPLSEFKIVMAKLWQTAIEKQGFGDLEMKFAPDRWQSLKESLRKFGGIERLAIPESWNLIELEFVYKPFF